MSRSLSKKGRNGMKLMNQKQQKYEKTRKRMICGQQFCYQKSCHSNLFKYVILRLHFISKSKLKPGS
jgi:hypothetical protein